MKKQAFVGLSLVVVAFLSSTMLMGCPSSEESLTVAMLWQDESGREFTEQVYPFEIINAPDGAIAEFDGAVYKNGIVKYKLSGFPEVIVQRLTVSSSKQVTSIEAHLIGSLIILAGHVIPAIIEGETPDQFQAVIPMGPSVETAVLEIDTSAGQFALTFRGAAYGGHTDPVGDRYVLTTSVQGQGTITGKPGDPAGVYDAGDIVAIEANPATGWTFVHWLVNGTVGSSNVVAQVTMDSDVHLVAVFQQESTATTYVLTTSVQGQGTITGKGGDPAGTYVSGEVVGVQANPATGWTFVHWLVNGSVGSSNAVAQVTMDSDVHLVAVFSNGTAPTNGLTIALTWSGSQLSLSATNAPANGVVGLELYHTAGGSPWVERETFTVNSSGTATGTVSRFRSTSSRILRFSVVTNASSGGYVPSDAVTVTLNGSTVPLVNDGNGNWAFQASI